MTERLPLEKLVLSTLETIDPSTIADESVRQTMQILLNRIEQLEAELKTVKEEKQQLRDENNRLKGE
jgi:uncharacterized protein (UPF0335 family)